MIKNYYIILILMLCVACGSNDRTERATSEKVYTCPMHPEIIRNEPGQCPICGMDLVEKLSDSTTALDTTLASVLPQTNKYVISNVTTVSPQMMSLDEKGAVTGYIAYDSRRVNSVSSRVEGRVEKLYVKYKYQPVKKGQVLMEIYSTELETEQENYLFLLQQEDLDAEVVKSAETKLLLMGMSKQQLAQLRSNKTTLPTIKIVSPYDGHLHDGKLADPAMNKDEMAPKDNGASESLTIKEGQYVRKGESIFSIFSTETVAAVFNVPQRYTPLLEIGTKVTVTVDGLEEPVEGIVSVVETTSRPAEENIPVRVYLENNNSAIKIGSIVQGKFTSENFGGLFIPETSVVNLGLSSVVFVKKNKVFVARKINAGRRIRTWMQVLNGLSVNDTIAKNAQLLMDSETLINTDKE